MRTKKLIADLSIFGGNPTFKNIRSTSNLVTPDIESFLKYTNRSFSQHQLSDNGPLVQELEQRLAGIHQTKHCVTFCNGFWGLVLTIKQLLLPGKTEVVMPAMTYRRLADIAAWVNLTPHFCDIDENTLGASVETVAACINDNTAIILIAQPIVNICDIEGLETLAKQHNIPIIFDSVEAAYASNKGRMIGSFGDAECFSMHASKLINGFEGGYMTTNNLELAQTVKQMSRFGYDENNNVKVLGVNAKLNEFHAAMSLASLDDLHDQIERNKARYQKYLYELENIKGITVVRYNEDETRGFKNILIKLTKEWPISRECTLDILHAENILARPYYFPPLHQKKTEYETVYGDLPVADKLTNEYMLLPSGEFLSLDDIPRLASLFQFLQRNGPTIQKDIKGIEK